MKTERRESRAGSREPQGLARSGLHRSALIPQHLRRAFTLIELLTVIAIIGVLVALVAPVLKNFSKPDVTVAATRQMLDDVSRARQLAILNRSTVFMVFVPTNFWAGPNMAAWSAVPNIMQTSTIVTQLYGAQWNGYFTVSLRDVGDQPGRTYPKALSAVKTLPRGAFIAPLKFSAAPYSPLTLPGNIAIPTNRPDLPIYGFNYTNKIPFPSVNILTNPIIANNYYVAQNARFSSVPFIAFNYLGQLAAADGTLLPYDENIPLDYGSIAEPVNPTNKAFAQGLPSVIETPPGNSTNISYNVIHIDRLTGRARLERQDQL